MFAVWETVCEKLSGNSSVSFNSPDRERMQCLLQDASLACRQAGFILKGNKIDQLNF